MTGPPRDHADPAPFTEPVALALSRQVWTPGMTRLPTN